MRRMLVAAVGAALLGTLVACVDQDGPTTPDTPRFLTVIGCDTTPSCSGGGGDVFASAPGYWLGSTVTPSQCFSASGAGINDADHDGLSDYCEWQLASKFEPELAYGSSDNVSREPRWAARGTAGEGGAVYITYLPSYRIDLGTDDPVCDSELINQWCRGHYGDSEWISLLVRYNAETQHWVLSAGYLSQHGSFALGKTGSLGYANFSSYPTRPGGFPRVFISYGKHANYDSVKSCNSGGAFGFDFCIVQAYAKVGITQSGNIGSEAYRLVNCVSSSDPFYSTNGVVECYWTGSRFSGWVGALPDATGYPDALRTNGFLP